MLSPTPSDSRPVAVQEGEPSPAQAGEPTSKRPDAPYARYAALAVALVMLGWSYSPNIRQLLHTWNRDPNYSHGYLVLPVALIILWRRWTDRDKEAIVPRPSPWGWVAL